MNAILSSNDVELLPVLPPSGDDFDFDAIDCNPSGPDVTVVDDFELAEKSGSPVLEILGEKSQMTFYTSTTLQHMALHIKSVSRFMALKMTILDNSNETREVVFSNKRSVVMVDKNKCYLPLDIGEGWQYLTIDFERICINAFGTHYVKCTECTVQGSCRLSKLFFQKQEYADVELPEFLRVCINED